MLYRTACAGNSFYGIARRIFEDWNRGSRVKMVKVRIPLYYWARDNEVFSRGPSTDTGENFVVAVVWNSADGSRRKGEIWGQASKMCLYSKNSQDNRWNRTTSSTERGDAGDIIYQTREGREAHSASLRAMHI